jgi:hypothetical protein
MGQLRRVQINKNQGGVGGQLPGFDHVSGLLYDISAYPTAEVGYTSLSGSNPIAKLLSLQDAINLGINDNHSDETKATGGQYLVTTAGAAGETVYIYIEPDRGIKTLLGSYTVKSGDAVADTASGLVDSVNLNTNSHGYSATLNTATVELTAPDKMGASINGTRLTLEAYTSTGAGGTAAATITQFTTGVGSEIAVLYYHLQQAFEFNSGIVIYLGLYDISTFDATKIEDIQNFASGDIRNMGVWTTNTYAASLITTLQTSAENLNDVGRPCSVVLDSDISGFTAATLPTLTTLISATKEAWVSGLAGQSSTGEGNRLMGVSGATVGTVGMCLGVMSASKVSQNIGELLSFDITNGTEFAPDGEKNGAGLGTGEQVRNLSDNLVKQLDNYRWIFTVKEDGVAGVFFSDSWTATSITNDFNAIERVRTIDKAGRNVKLALTPLINSELNVDPSTGELSASTIELFKGEAFNAIEQMAKDDEISTLADGTLPSDTVIIDPNQDVLSTNEVVISIAIVPKGIARKIVVNIKFTRRV